MLGASSSNDTGVADEDKGIKAEERVAQLVSQIEELRSENRRIIQQNEELHRCGTFFFLYFFMICLSFLPPRVIN